MINVLIHRNLVLALALIVANTAVLPQTTKSVKKPPKPGSSASASNAAEQPTAKQKPAELTIMPYETFGWQPPASSREVIERIYAKSGLFMHFMVQIKGEKLATPNKVHVTNKGELIPDRETTFGTGRLRIAFIDDDPHFAKISNFR